ncbi:hypothetical protein B5S28_g301 [[Candida] boidinii]|nr:hypothetical protein B5S28_g301 [[Candida] boidinii]
MNVLNSISPAALFLNSSIQNQHIKITPPKLLYFFIFNPSLSDFINYPKNPNSEIIEEEDPNSSKKYDENDTQSLINQLVCYVSFEDREIEASEKANKLSFIHGIIQFTDKFQHSRSQDLSYIDTDISRIIIGKYEANEEFLFVASFEFAYYFPNSDNHIEKNKKYLPNLLASPVYLKSELEKSYKLFTLHFGTLKYYIKNKISPESIIKALGSDNVNKVETSDFKDIREWWRVWLTKYWRDGDNENKDTSSISGVDNFLIKDKGFLNLFKGYRNSSINLPLGFRENLNVFFKKFLNSNSGSESVERRQSILSNSDQIEIEDENTFYENDEILDIIVMNSNWYPTKNFGVLWSDNCNNNFNDTNNSDTDDIDKIHPDSLCDLINYIENLDLYIGLSSYSIQLNNMPSIKEYLELIKDVEENEIDIREFLNRSFLKPTTDLINNKILNNFNPLSLATNAITSISTMTYNLIPDVTSTTNTVLQSVNPFNYSLFGGSGISNSTSNNTHSNTVITENAEVNESGTSRSNSTTSIDNSSNKSKLDKKLESGSFLVGLNNENDLISFKEVYLTLKKDNCVSKHNLILYEINGILFIIVIKNDEDSINLIKTRNYYKQLSLKLMKIYRIYFEELVIKQINELNELKSLDYSSPSLVSATADDALSSSIASANKISAKYRRKEFKNNKILFLQQQQNFQETFYYFLYDTKTKEYQTSFPNVILNDEIEILKFMNSFKNVGYKENEEEDTNDSSTVSKDNNEDKLDENELKLSKLNKLQNIYINKIVINFLLQDYINDRGEIIPVDQTDNVISELERDELLIKTNKNWWLLRKNLKEQNRVIIIAKKFKQTDSQRFKIFSSSSSSTNGHNSIMNGQGSSIGGKVRGLDNSGRTGNGSSDMATAVPNSRDSGSSSGGRSFSQQQYQQVGNGNNRHYNDNSIIESLGGDVSEWFNTFCKI